MHLIIYYCLRFGRGYSCSSIGFETDWVTCWMLLKPEYRFVLSSASPILTLPSVAMPFILLMHFHGISGMVKAIRGRLKFGTSSQNYCEKNQIICLCEIIYLYLAKCNNNLLKQFYYVTMLQKVTQSSLYISLNVEHLVIHEWQSSHCLMCVLMGRLVCHWGSELNISFVHWHHHHYCHHIFIVIFPLCEMMGNQYWCALWGRHNSRSLILFLDEHIFYSQRVLFLFWIN